MKVYQIHKFGEYCGEACHLAEKVYLHKDKAEAEKKKIEQSYKAQNANYEDCIACPIRYLTKRKYNNNPKIVSDYCKSFMPEIDGNYIDCQNRIDYVDEYFDVKIEEIEVIE